MVGITEGGRRSAQDIARRLGVAVGLVRARHNRSDAPYAPATGSAEVDAAALESTLHRLFATSPHAGTLLLVDDICGTGTTLATVIAAINQVKPSGLAVRTATLCRNAAAPPGVPDVHIWDVADWVHFDWEPALGRGTAPAITPLPMPTRVIEP